MPQRGAAKWCRSRSFCGEVPPLDGPQTTTLDQYLTVPQRETHSRIFWEPLKKGQTEIN
ncbi:hypothetical protein X777_11077 [Ooceraea biroi]|uniref:Uncharacterized protein n=1 Tax=Ooceraea biroi TaxID=2015173 RepID=A0A026W5D2_OOCBI|nr:hypothetical protein X777_11077 [Ooceraea biroi]